MIINIYAIYVQTISSKVLVLGKLGRIAGNLALNNKEKNILQSTSDYIFFNDLINQRISHGPNSTYKS